MSLFTVIIPTYNRPRFLREAVDSVLAQTIRDFEIVVVNDAGPDPENLPSDSRLKVVTRRQNGGIAAARNSGLAVAGGRYVAFLDDDDLYTPTRLEIALEGLARAPISLCLMRAFRGDPHRAGPRRGRKLEGEVHEVILDGPTPQVGRVALQRELAPLFNEAYLACEDVEWWLRLSALGRVTTVPEVGLLQRGHAGLRHLSTARARLEFNRRLMEDHRDYFAARPQARSFREQRIGIRALGLGEESAGREALVRSLRDSPSIRSAWHLVRSFLSDRKPTHEGD